MKKVNDDMKSCLDLGKGWPLDWNKLETEINNCKQSFSKPVALFKSAQERVTRVRACN